MEVQFDTCTRTCEGGTVLVGIDELDTTLLVVDPSPAATGEPVCCERKSTTAPTTKTSKMRPTLSGEG